MFFDYVLLDTIVRALALSSVAVCWVIVVVRTVGLRTLSKMTAFDFVITIATGSLLAGASQATNWSEFLQATLAIAALLGVQYAVARLRRSSAAFKAMIQNSPVLLMRDGKMITAALERTRVAEDDLVAKLREANVLDFSEVRAVVLETTGDISVLHGKELQDRLLGSVQRID